jgi:methylated-DNA-[protein]-cysteine S-methyltransferase
MRTKSQKKKSQEWTVCLKDTPLGPLHLTFTAKGLAALDFADKGGEITPGSPPPPGLRPMIDAVKRQLRQYFAEGVADFTGLPLDLQGTPFQKRVWRELPRIPRGQTISYQELAERIGSPRGFRAAGQANRRNPVPIIIPCHRVIAADGSLGGYSSGIERKAWLLKHEAAR